MGGGEALASSEESGIESGEWTAVTRQKRTKRRYYMDTVKGGYVFVGMVMVVEGFRRFGVENG
jgi:hypothetical protein